MDSSVRAVLDGGIIVTGQKHGWKRTGIALTGDAASPEFPRGKDQFPLNQQGESRFGQVRILFISPLVVDFQVFADDLRVDVLFVGLPIRKK